MIFNVVNFKVKSVANLRELHLCRVELSTEQLVLLLEAIIACGNLQEVNLTAMDLSQVTLFESIIARGNFQEVNFSAMDLSEVNFFETSHRLNKHLIYTHNLLQVLYQNVNQQTSASVVTELFYQKRAYLCSRFQQKCFPAWQKLFPG